MKLQGVIILRITDFRRFFDLDEFLVKKQEFIELMRRYGSRQFCDSPQERDLCGVVRNWINGDPFTAEIRDDKLLISGANGRSAFELGPLKEQIEKYKEKLGFKDLYGLTALCLLAGAGRKDCAFKLDYGVLVNEKAGWNIDSDFISLHKDVELPKAVPASSGAFRLRILANLNSGGPVRVSAGDESVTLKEGQCVAGIFSESGCVTLFRREASALPGIHASLVADKANKRANLVLSQDGRSRTIPGVNTVWIEPSAGVAYVTKDGSVVFDQDKCYKLKSRMNIFHQNSKDCKLLSVKKSDNGNYVLFTDTQIHH